MYRSRRSKTVEELKAANAGKRNRLDYAAIRKLERTHGIIPTDDLALFAWMAASGIKKSNLPSIRIYQVFKTWARKGGHGYMSRQERGAFREAAGVSWEDTCVRLGIEMPGKRRDTHAEHRRESSNRPPMLRTRREDDSLTDRFKRWHKNGGPRLVEFMQENGVPQSRMTICDIGRAQARVMLPYESIIVTVPLLPKGLDLWPSRSADAFFYLNAMPLPLPG